MAGSVSTWIFLFGLMNSWWTYDTIAAKIYIASQKAIKDFREIMIRQLLLDLNSKKIQYGCRTNGNC